ncbi:MAG: class I SAM-dependent methyltransferase [Flavobacteriales bacterium]|nr:class I SAM-dependent methyltransferase [Flavobacteriales bacterium]
MSKSSLIKRWYRFLSPRWQSIHLDYPVTLSPRHEPGSGNSHVALEGILKDRVNVFHEEVEKILGFEKDLLAIRKRDEEPNSLLPGWNNGFLPGLDMASLFSFIASRKPKRYIEVGSGNSTLVAAAAKAQHSTRTEIISIDPFPRADIDQVSQTIVRKPFESIDSGLADTLEPGDILFIDNSHRVLPNSDATVAFLEWFPRLKPGVLVQVHDIYIPWDYPQNMCDRAYSEQYMLAMALLSNPQRYKPLFPAYWISKQEQFTQLLSPLWDHPNTRDVEQHGGSFWFEIGSDPLA